MNGNPREPHRYWRRLDQRTQIMPVGSMSGEGVMTLDLTAMQNLQCVTSTDLHVKITRRNMEGNPRVS